MTLESDPKEFESRLEAVRAWEPRVRALVDWNEMSARKRFAEAGSGPLAGWSLGVKDIVDVEAWRRVPTPASFPGGPPPGTPPWSKLSGPAAPSSSARR